MEDEEMSASTEYTLAIVLSHRQIINMTLEHGQGAGGVPDMSACRKWALLVRRHIVPKSIVVASIMLIVMNCCAS